MEETSDPALVAFEGREDKAIRRAYVDKSQEETNARRAAQRKNKPNKLKKQKLIKVIPKRTIDGVSVLIEHTLPKQLELQQIHVTLKQDGKRLERKIIDVSGTGKAEISFPVPSDLKNTDLSVAAFVGDDYSENLQHVVTSIK
jgi:hypothetical protein